jgi:hypothetical protein
MLVHRVEGLLSKAIFTTMVIGTDNNIPAGPHTQPQKIRDKNTTRVERPSFRPMSFGSRGVTEN